MQNLLLTLKSLHFPHTHTHTHTQKHKHKNTHTHKNTNTKTHTHKNTNTKTHTHTQKHKHKNTHTHTQKHKHKNTHTHTVFNVLYVVLTVRNNYFSTSLSRLIIKILEVQKIKRKPKETVTFNAIYMRFGAIIAVNMKICL